MEIIVGRKGTQRTPISDLTVSREHCKITIQANGSILLENLSSSGTYLNGRSVIKTTITSEDVIQLGPQFCIRVKDLLPQQATPSNAPKAAPAPQNGPATPNSPKTGESKSYAAEFARLKHVYEKYTSEKIAIQKESSMNNFYRMLPMSIVGLIGLGAMFIPSLRDIAPFTGVAGIGLFAFSLIRGYNLSKETPERMQSLNDQFMIDYVCPKCGNFLGFIPFESLKNRGTCNSCKCNWK